MYIVLILSIGLQALTADDEVTETTVDSTEMMMADSDKMSLGNEKVKECQNIPENGSEKIFKIELRGTGKELERHNMVQWN